MTGERLAQFTQSYVQIECQGNKNRTPNAAQKDQHAPVWNATIKIPVTIPAKLGKAAEKDLSGSEDDQAEGYDSEGDEDIHIEVFF